MQVKVNIRKIKVKYKYRKVESLYNDDGSDEAECSPQHPQPTQAFHVVHTLLNSGINSILIFSDCIFSCTPVSSVESTYPSAL